MHQEKKKQCKKCRKSFPVSNFYVSLKTGVYSTYCKECEKIIKKEWYIKNKERVDAKRKQWQKENYHKHLKHQRKYNQSEKGKAAQQRYKEKVQTVLTNSLESTQHQQQK